MVATCVSSVSYQKLEKVHPQNSEEFILPRHVCSYS